MSDKMIYCDSYGFDVHESACKNCSLPERWGTGITDCIFRGVAQEDMI